MHVEVGRILINILKRCRYRAIVGVLVVYSQMMRILYVLWIPPDSPEIVKPTAKGSSRNLQDLQHAEGMIWTFISPSAEFDFEGKHTGTYMLEKINYYLIVKVIVISVMQILLLL